MPADAIERQIDIDAPIDVVWSVVTEPEHIAAWFTDSAELDLRPGGEGRFVFRERATSRPAAVNLRVERVEPPRFFSFRWAYPDGVEPDQANSLLVEFTLESAGDATRLSLIESGFDVREHADRDKERESAEHETGWDVHLASLRRYAGEQRSSVAG